ncbi:hypothetical protein C1H46_006013 [Malus baccata]|uniref:Uncharacterized protein n=1 Tax=Malus baccata TaxID=106549 RepID=A0A540NBG4_MALBA|nr:hypothetical protein C1H46_006013 [Malus baccata]
MGCFLACFGFSKKKKRRKPATKAAGGDHRRVSYVPLDSSVTIIGIDGAKECSKSELCRDKAKEQTRLKTRKKVSFNPNVQTYEPISTDYRSLESYEEEDLEEKNVKSLSTSASKRDSTTLRLGLFPSNYSREGFSEELCSASRNGESEYPNARDYKYVHSVLSPVENLIQWKAAKAAKAKTAAPQKHQKENIAIFQQPQMPYSSRSNVNRSTKPLLQQIPVHASLSSWLNSQSSN